MQKYLLFFSIGQNYQATILFLNKKKVNYPQNIIFPFSCYFLNYSVSLKLD